jgi:hypothetical protein
MYGNIIVKNSVYLGTVGSQLPVILAIQEAEIRRIAVRSQPWQIVFKTLP